MTAKELQENLSKKLDAMDKAVALVMTPHQTIELGLLQNMLSMLNVIVQQNDILIRKFCPELFEKQGEETSKLEIVKQDENNI